MKDSQKILSLEALRALIVEKALLLGEKKLISTTGGLASWAFDFRPLLMDATFLRSISTLMLKQLEVHAPLQIGGMESAAIPLVSSLVLLSDEEKNIKGFYIRKSRKKTGLQNFIEGNLGDSKVILVDDVLSSGRSMMRAIDIVEKEGKKVFALFTIIRYHDLSFYQHLAERGVTIFSLFTLADFPGISYTIPPKQLPAHFTGVWKFQNAEANFFYVIPKSGPVIDSKNIYFGADDGYFRALRQSDGSEVWKFKVHANAHGKYIFSSPALHNGVVYFGAYDGFVYALNVSDGSVIWTFSDSEWVSSSPALALELNLLFIGLEQGLEGRQGALVALDLQTGEKKWWAEMPAYNASSPGYSKEYGIVISGCNDGVVRAYEAGTGRLIWSFQTRGEVKASFAFDNERRLVVFGGMDGCLYMLKVETGEFVHSIEYVAGIFSTPLVEGKYVYVGGLDHKVHCIDIENGNEKWAFETNGRIFSSPVMYKGDLYIGSNDGWLYVLNPENGKVNGLAHTTERIVNKVAINTSTGRIFVPTHACEILCLQKKL